MLTTRQLRRRYERVMTMTDQYAKASTAHKHIRYDVWFQRACDGGEAVASVRIGFNHLGTEKYLLDQCYASQVPTSMARLLKAATGMVVDGPHDGFGSSDVPLVDVSIIGEHGREVVRVSDYGAMVVS